MNYLNDFEKIILAIAVSLLGFVIFLVYRFENLKASAVDNGHAEWVVDSYGVTEWRWKEVRSE